MKETGRDMAIVYGKLNSELCILLMSIESRFFNLVREFMLAQCRGGIFLGIGG